MTNGAEVTDTAPGYVLGSSDAERQRLVRQARVFAAEAGQAADSTFLLPAAAVTAVAWLRAARKRCWAPCFVSP